MVSLHGEPYGVNYAPSTPLRERLGSYFADDIVRAVHIGLDGLPIRRSIQPPLYPLAAEGGRGLGGVVDGQWITIEEARLAGVTLLGEPHLDAHQFGLVPKHRDEARVGD